MTHRAPSQFLRLVNKLNAMFDFPPIVAHHDFGQCALPLDEFSSNVQFVRPHLQTAWADWSVVEVTTRALAQLFEMPNAPRRFVVLSGADYPIKPASQIVRELDDGDFDAHINFLPVHTKPWKDLQEQICFERYCTQIYTVPSINKKLRFRTRDVRISHPLLTRFLLPYHREKLQPFTGWQWFCGNEKAARAILEFHRTRPALAKHMSSRVMCAEEAYFHTILVNTPHLKLHNDDLRYVDWSLGGAHPKTLTVEDIPAMLASKDHFARKFDENNTQVLDELDQLTQ